MCIKKLKSVILFFLFIVLITPSTVFADENVQTGNNTGIADNETLLTQYLNVNTTQKGTLSLKGEEARVNLPVAEKRAYDFYKPEIEKIASGQRTDTVIQVPLMDCIDGVVKEGNEWRVPRSLLGVDNLTQTSADGIVSLSDETKLAMRKLCSLNGKQICDALLEDVPYDFYWYDKLTGWKSKWHYDRLSVHDNDYLAFTDPGYFQMTFHVTKEYSETNEVGTTTTSAAKTKAASSAVSTVNSIISKYSGSSDVEKLRGYAKEICALTEYDNNADWSTYGNTWQLINVFDNNANTKVVCEGYSKAFQFLCDKSSFKSKNIKCRSVYGKLATNGNNRGSHMWNVIQMDDGENYLVDLTNSDAGDTCNNSLFLKGYETGSLDTNYGVGNSSFEYDSGLRDVLTAKQLTLANHDYKEQHVHSGTLVPAVPATCDKAGTKEYYTCDCGKIFSDSACTKEISQSSLSVPALGHDWGEWTEVTPATETSEGVEQRVCANDPSHVQTRTIPAITHVHSLELIKGKDATCEADGSREYYKCSSCNKMFSDSNGQNEITDVVIPKLGHKETSEKVNEVKPTCTEKGGYDEVVKCERCGKEISKKHVDEPALGHSWGEWTTVTEATATAEGQKKRVCSVCKEEETAPIPIAGHQHTEGQPVKENIKDPTCTEKGSYDEVVYCSECKEELSRKTVETDATGHKWSEWKVTTEPTETSKGEETRSCENCKKTETREIPAAEHKHTNGEPVKENEKPATCTEKGSYDEVIYCTECKKEVSRKTVETEAWGHKWGEWEVTKVPTTTAKGEETRKCSVCQLTETREIEALVHNHTNGEPVKENEKAATCTEKGSYDEVIYCTECKKEISRKKVETDALGHKWGEWTVVGDKEERTCSVCNEKESRKPTDGSHKHTNGTPVKENEKAATCTEKGSYDEVIYCTECKKEVSRKKVETDALGHKWGEWVKDNGTEKRICEVCKAEEKRNETGHTHVNAPAVKENEKAATCEGKGSYEEVIYCSECKAEISRKTVEVAPLGHDWSEAKVSKEPTETTPGEQVRECKVCHKRETSEIPALGHQHKLTLVPEVDATPTSTGKKAYYKCECGMMFADKDGKQVLTEEDLVIPKVAYITKEGSGQTWVRGSSQPLNFRFARNSHDNETIKHFKGIKIDDNIVTDYSVKSGSVVISLDTKYLNTLSLGSHKITALFDDGSAEETFKVAVADKVTEESEDEVSEDKKDASEDTTSDKGNTNKKVTPKTGDSPAVFIWMSVLLLSFVFYLKKRY